MKTRFAPERIKALRTELGLSQYDFGKTIGQPPQVISMYEKGQTAPQVKVLARMSERYDKPIDYFFITT